MQQNAITYCEMMAYQTMQKIHITKFELDAIEILDSIALSDPMKLKKGKHEYN